ncbi:MAG: biotin--[acetyl-CoA-carboxylase] ligase [Verrucomicrobia bacterium GWF2_51_19]|nr:MAG: biotin--[acetyl-CoA-carboxylase] ligase [Verrucomicrobia bacterium GWF2_51_19]HCJ12394.1 biotin--[acetyl-CoA-carboxylase] ligase [Opitutae bacterium]
MKALFYKTVDSTQSVVVREMERGADVPLFVLAEEQTTGRGRKGQPWVGARAQNVYLSAGFHPLLTPTAMQPFTLRMGLAICRAINANLGVLLQLKWPNDLYFEGQKVGGMLAESVIREGLIADLIFGIGLNVNQTTFPSLESRPISLAQILGKPLELKHVAESLMQTIFEAYNNFIAAPDAEWTDEWAELDYLCGKNIIMLVDNTTLVGTAQGVTPLGELRVATPNDIVLVRAGTFVKIE